MAIEHYGADTQPVVMIKLAEMTAWAIAGERDKAHAISQTIPLGQFDLTKPSTNAVRYLAARAVLARTDGDGAAAAADLTLAHRMITALGHNADGVRREVLALR